MKRVVVVHRGEGDAAETVEFLGQEVEITRRGCGNPGRGGVRRLYKRARTLLLEADGHADAIALDGLPAELELGPARRAHAVGSRLAAAAQRAPVVDGSGVRGGLERWGIQLAARAQPGIFSQKRVLMVPGLNHNGMAQALERRAAHLAFADPEIFFGLPELPGVGSRATLGPTAGPTLDRLRSAPFDRLRPAAGPGSSTLAAHTRRSDVLAGDLDAILRFGPRDLRRKIVVVEHADEAGLNALRERGTAWAVTLMPSLSNGEGLGRWSAAVVEAVLVALRPDPEIPRSEDTYLNLLAGLEWAPEVRPLQPEEAEVHRFAFVIHPLDVSFIHRHPAFWWTRYLPGELVERIAAWMPPLYISSVRGGRSPATGQRIEGHLISLAATPRQMMIRPERFTYNRLNRAARLAERMGARILGLGAFTSVVGDAGVTVAHEAGIAVTSGNSLTVAATLEAAKQAVRAMGKEDLTHGRAMVIGATGSIGSVCARLLAQAIRDVVLVSIEPDRLIELRRRIEAETPGARVEIATRAGHLARDCDLVVTATSAFGQRVLDITTCKPGAVICDVARPPDLSPAEAALRPDVLVIESGEVVIPGEVDFGYDIGLPPGVAYACLAETALLAMEGRFESFTLGRELSMVKVKEIYRLFKKHGFRIAALHSFGEEVTEKTLEEKRRLARRLRRNRERFETLCREARAKLEALPMRSKGVPASNDHRAGWWLAAGGAAALGVLALRRRGTRTRKPEARPPS
jgi:predicted amino acid dehydrogenase